MPLNNAKGCFFLFFGNDVCSCSATHGTPSKHIAGILVVGAWLRMAALTSKLHTVPQVYIVATKMCAEDTVWEHWEGWKFSSGTVYWHNLDHWRKEQRVECFKGTYRHVYRSTRNCWHLCLCRGTMFREEHTILMEGALGETVYFNTSLRDSAFGI